MARAKRVPSSVCERVGVMTDDACVVHKRVFNTLECEHTIDFDSHSTSPMLWCRGKQMQNDTQVRSKGSGERSSKISKDHISIMSFTVHSRIISLRTNSHIMI